MPSVCKKDFDTLWHSVPFQQTNNHQVHVRVHVILTSNTFGRGVAGAGAGAARLQLASEHSLSFLPSSGSCCIRDCLLEGDRQPAHHSCALCPVCFLLRSFSACMSVPRCKILLVVLNALILFAGRFKRSRLDQQGPGREQVEMQDHSGIGRCDSEQPFLSTGTTSACCSRYSSATSVTV